MRFPVSRLALALACFLFLQAGPVRALNFSEEGRWKAPTSLDKTSKDRGDAVRLSWSIPADGTPIEWPAWSPATSTLKLYYSTHCGADPHQMFGFIFGRIGEVSGLSFQECPDDGTTVSAELPGIARARGDFRVVGSDLARIQCPGSAVCNMPNPGKSCVVHVSTGRPTNYKEALRIVMHEVGHGVGFAHQNIYPDLTAPEFRTPSGEYGSITGFLNSAGPQFDDLYALHRMYGDRWERNGGNDTFTTVTFLGNLGEGPKAAGTQVKGLAVAPAEVDFLSIDGSSDKDCFLFQIDRPMQVTVQVTPKGPTYAYAPEGGKRVLFEASRQSNLRFELADAEGKPLEQADKGGLGAAEILIRDLPAGRYFLTVAGTEDKNQFYRLDAAAR